MTLQDNSRQAVIDFYHYTQIFNEAKAGKQAQADKNAADKSSGTPTPTQYPSHAPQCP